MNQVQLFDPERQNIRRANPQLLRIVLADVERSAMSDSQYRKWDGYRCDITTKFKRPTFPTTKRNITKYWDKEVNGGIFNTNSVVIKDDKQKLTEIENEIKNYNKLLEKYSQASALKRYDSQLLDSDEFKGWEELSISFAEASEKTIYKIEELRNKWLEALNSIQDRLLSKVESLDIAQMVLNDFKPALTKHEIDPSEINSIIQSFKNDEQTMLNSLRNHTFQNCNFFKLTFP